MLSGKMIHLALPACALFALAGCETVAEEATEAVGHEFVAMLSPSGSSANMGKAEISLNDANDMLCTDLEIQPSVAMTAGHILGPGGAVVADIDVPDDNDSDDCDEVADALVDEIRANPSGFYVNVHTNDFPGGAVRGQLALSQTAVPTLSGWMLAAMAAVLAGVALLVARR